MGDRQYGLHTRKPRLNVLTIFFTHEITHNTKYSCYKLESLHSWVQDGNAGNTSTSFGDSFPWAEYKAKKKLIVYITFVSLNLKKERKMTPAFSVVCQDDKQCQQ